jgi:hypothetical protein
MAESRFVIRTCLTAAGRASKTGEFVPRTVKSFAATSVRDSSSGNSVATIPHSKMASSTGTRNFPTRDRVRAILRPLGEVIHPPGITGKRYIGDGLRSPRQPADASLLHGRTFISDQLTAMNSTYTLRSLKYGLRRFPKKPSSLNATTPGTISHRVSRLAGLSRIADTIPEGDSPTC